MKYFFNFIFSNILIICFLCGCESKERTANVNKQKNDTKRLIVTNSNALELLIALGADDNIVATNDMGKKSFIKEGKKWNSIGKWQSPNIEAIVNLKPDVIVSYQKWPEPIMFEKKLAPFNINVDRINCYMMAEYHNDINKLASYVGKEEKAKDIINDFDSIVTTIKNAVSKVETKKKVYVEFSEYTSLNKFTGNHEMLMLANVENIASEFPVQYPKISTEWLLNEKPDYIFKIVSNDILNQEAFDKFISRPGWNSLDAVKNNKVYLLSPEICSGARAMIGALYVAEICYPELFQTTTADLLHKYWLTKYYNVEYEPRYTFH